MERRVAVAGRYLCLNGIVSGGKIGGFFLRNANIYNIEYMQKE